MHAEIRFKKFFTMKTEAGLHLHFELKNTAILRFSDDSEYSGVISPYSRMYLITEGTGHLVTGTETLFLEPGFMYLIPGYVQCSYFFGKALEHIYIHFRVVTKNELTVYHFITCHHKIPATPLTIQMFRRLTTLHPDLQLPHHDPQVYQAKPWMDKKPSYLSPGQQLETEAILQFLFSGFVESTTGLAFNTNEKYHLQQILNHIQQNLHNDIKINDLAEIACLSKDHFTRTFKTIMGEPPCEYIIRKRIEKAQFLLLSTDYPINRIIDETNFKSTPYFTRTFRRFTSLTPGEYRRKRIY